MFPAYYRPAGGYVLNGQGSYKEADREALTPQSAQGKSTVILRSALVCSLNGQARPEAALAEAERTTEVHRSLPRSRAAQ